MKILIYSPLFYPSIGGLETVVSILAHEFFCQGCEVKLISYTFSTDSKTFPFEVIRQPKFKQVLNLVSWCDLYFQPNISLKGIYPLLIYPKTWVVAHNNWYRRSNGRLSWRDCLKHFLIRYAANISVSQSIADHITPPSTVIPNPYQEDLFYLRPQILRDRELIFLGRLVSDKGVDLLLKAIFYLKQQGISPNLTIVGHGPEEAKIQQQAKTLEINNQVKFVGSKVGEELACLLNAHQILVVPSRWQEPFGVVALEGIACGCVVVGSEGGGLKEAIGPCGVTFPNGDVNALTQTLANLLTHPEGLACYRKETVAHLSRHRKTEVAKAYLRVFEEVL